MSGFIQMTYRLYPDGVLALSAWCAVFIHIVHNVFPDSTAQHIMQQTVGSVLLNRFGTLAHISA